MPKCVQYRDLPGGPIEIQFSDDLSHWTLCGPCGMLSAEMYKDPQGHVFCKVCLHACSGKERIFCKHENRNIQLSDLFEAHDVVRITQSLTVFCPNKKNGCSTHCDLSKMKEHYVECPMTPDIKCKACQANVLVKDITDHEKLCPEVLVQCQRCFTGIPRRALEDHQRECGREQTPPKQQSTNAEGWKAPVWKAPVSLPCMGAEAANGNEQGPSSLGSNSEDEKIVCELCQKTVKCSLYEKHISFCLKECPYCEEKIPNNKQTEHRNTCEKNPDNVSAREPPKTPVQNPTFAEVLASSLGEKGTAVYDWKTSDVGAAGPWSTGAEAKACEMVPAPVGSSSPPQRNQRPLGASPRLSFGRGRGTLPLGGVSSVGWVNQNYPRDSPDHNSRASPECSDRRGTKPKPGVSSAVGRGRTDSSHDSNYYENGTVVEVEPADRNRGDCAISVLRVFKQLLFILLQISCRSSCHLIASFVRIVMFLIRLPFGLLQLPRLLLIMSLFLVTFPSK